MAVSDPFSVLLIDPDRHARNYWSERLKTACPDCRILEADTGEAGLTICRNESLDCVVTELDLPDMSGFQVLLELVPRAQQPEIAVIILTKLTLHSLSELALKNGAQAFLVKNSVGGDDLDRAIYRATNAIGSRRKELRFGQISR